MDLASLRTLALLVWGNPIVKAVLGLMLANILAGVAAALYTRTFRLGGLADWLATRALPYLLGAGVIEIVLLTVPPEWSGFSSAAGNAVWLSVCLALVGHVLDALRDLGLPVPASLTDRSVVVTATGGSTQSPAAHP